MSERPALSISVSRRPSLRASISGSSTPALVSSPLTSHPPITPQNAHFWDSYFPAPGAGVVGLQTPPLNAQPSLYPPAGTFPGRKGLLRRNSSLSSVSSSVVEDDEDEQEWTHDEEEQVQRVRHLLATLQVNDGPRADLSLSLSLCADLRCLPRQARPHRGTLPCQRPPAVQLHQHGRARRAARSRREWTSRGSPRALHPGGRARRAGQRAAGCGRGRQQEVAPQPEEHSAQDPRPRCACSSPLSERANDSLTPGVVRVQSRSASWARASRTPRARPTRMRRPSGGSPSRARTAWTSSPTCTTRTASLGESTLSHLH